MVDSDGDTDTASRRREPDARQAFDLVGLGPLMRRTAGHPDVWVGLIDGPVARGLAVLPDDGIVRLPGAGGPVAPDALEHGTFVAGLLKATRSPAGVSGLCPGCTLVSRPIFSSAPRSGGGPVATGGDLATALHELIDAGVRVVNLSVAALRTSPGDRRLLTAALDRAMVTDTLVVAAAGNQPVVGSSPIVGHPWVIPVAAFSLTGRPLGFTTLGASIGRRGVGAPGEGVPGPDADGATVAPTGTSVAAAVVTGAIALVLSAVPDVGGRVVQSALRCAGPRRSVVPPLLDAESLFSRCRAGSREGVMR